MKTIILISALLASSAAFASSVTDSPRFCDQAVSAAACGDAKEYVRSIAGRVEHDSSPNYIKMLDSRYNGVFAYANGPGGNAGAAAAAASASTGTGSGAGTGGNGSAK